MKKYSSPIISVEKFDISDVLMVSSVTTADLTSNIKDQLTDVVFSSTKTEGSTPIVDSGAVFYLN